MSSSERAVIYVESGTELSSLASTAARHSLTSLRGPKTNSEKASVVSGNNYVIKIQIGEETVFNPVRIDVSSAKDLRQLNGVTLVGEDSPLNSSGQSSPRSDMTPPPRINAGVIRFGSETSESDTESDVSAEFRPTPCPAAQFAMREICEIGEPRSIMKQAGAKSKAPKSVTVTSPKQSVKKQPEFISLADAFSNNVNSHLSINHGRSSLPPVEKEIKEIINEIPLKKETTQGFVPPPVPQSGNQKSKVSPVTSSVPVAVQVAKAAATKTIVVKNIEKIAQNKKILVDQNSFHLNEINDCNGSVANEKPDSLSNFAGYKDIFARTNKDEQRQIMSDKGTIRGVKNRVRDGIATFLQSNDTKTYNDKEQGRVVVYVTSMGVVRDTFQRCQKVKQILRTLLVKFDERDCYMNRSIQNEIRHRLPNFNHNIALPQVFLEGQHLGDADVIEKLNETGELRDLLRPYKSLSVLTTCERCGGFRMLPCPICNGSKKSVHRNHFTTEFIALKCMHCDPSGLVRCDLCNAVDS